MRTTQSLTLCGALFLAHTSSSAPVINEFLASNEAGLTDVDSEFSDWIEIHNPDALAYDLSGHHLTDDDSNLDNWTFPAGTNVTAGGYLVVFASGKDRAVAGAQLHTDFKLGSGGEYLALVAPDGLTVLDEFSPEYPPQFEDNSFGIGIAGSGGGAIDLTPAWNYPGNYSNITITGAAAGNESGTADNLDTGAGGAFTQFYTWFDFSSRLSQIPPGSTVTSATLQWNGTVIDPVFGVPAATSKLGIFTVPDANHGIDTVAAAFTGSDLRDYYAANIPAAEFTAVAGTTPNVTWDIAALVQSWVDNPLVPRRGQIMILNDSAPMFMDWNTDGASKPTITLGADTVAGGGGGADPLMFFDTPTPGVANGSGTLAGPVFESFTKHPPQPVSGALTVTAEIRTLASPITGVNLFYRRMFNGETALAMKDDGSGGDEVAGDRIWTAIIPATAIAPAEMTRWRFEAADAGGGLTQEPPFREPLDSHQYWGTVGHDPSIETNLSVVHRFLANPSAADGNTGTRGGLFYLGEFYDNVHFNRHGQSTGGFPKKSYNIDFNKSQRFRWSYAAPRTADIDLLTNWADKSKVRHVLAYEVMRESGVHAHFAFTVRVQQNGEFFSTADFVEDADEIYLSRAGLNPEGALYKVYSNSLNKDRSPPDTANSGVEKKNRRSEGNADLQALIDGLDLTGPALTAYLFDNIDIPKTINMLAANSVIRNIDMHRKNWYIYRDTGATDEWAILPWDLDLSGGRVWNSANTYFDNALYDHGFVLTGGSIRLVSHLQSNAGTRQMLLRRIRTLSDRFLQDPNTPLAERWYERRLDEQASLIDDPFIAKSDAQLDFEKWGSWVQGSGSQVPYTSTNPDVEDMAEAIVRWKDEYLPGRRDEIYNNQTVGNGGEIPGPQDSFIDVTYTPLVVAGATAKFTVPANGNDGVNWLGIPANEPFNDSPWTSGPTGIGYERGSGYAPLIASDVNAAMSSGNSLYVRIPFDVVNPAAFNTLELRMQYDDGFVAFLNGTVIASANAPAPLAWNSASSGLHEASVGAFDVFNITDKISSLAAGQNILAIQGLNQGTGSSDFIITPELHAGTAITTTPGPPTLNFGAVEFDPASGNQDEEYIELVNPTSIAVDISGWYLEDAVEFMFQPGTVIPAGGSLFVSPDVNAFRARGTSPTGGEGHFVQGGYAGHLSNFGETIDLLEPDETLNQRTTYVGNPSDQQLYLVVSEIMYHPEPDGAAEYIELLNISDSVTVSMNGVRFVNGVQFDFTGSAITSLAPGERVLVVRDTTAFTAAHGGGLPVAGEFSASSTLDNSGELIKLEDPDNGTIHEFTYNDKAPWPEAPDSGYSLVLINPTTRPEHGNPANWRSSGLLGGTPDGSDTVPPPADPLGDADGNFIADLVDHALGNDLGLAPIAPIFLMQLQEVGSGIFELRPTITYPISLGAETATTEIELSSDLSSWSSDPADITVVSTQNLGDGRALVIAFVNAPLAEGARLFYRVVASD